MKRVLFSAFIALITTYNFNTFSQEKDSIPSLKDIDLDNVVVESLRAKDDTPMPFKNITKVDIKKLILDRIYHQYLKAALLF